MKQAMSSLLFSSKLSSLRKLMTRTPLRMFSSTTTNPCLMYRVLEYRVSEENSNAITDVHYFDPVKEDEVVVRDKLFPGELDKGYIVGMSHGWAVFMADRGKKKAVYVSDYCNPLSSKSNPKVIPLQSVFKVKDCQVEVITNAAMSCSPDQSTDFALAVKCLGRQINFSRPGGKHDNSHLIIFTIPALYFDHSKIMHSKRDQKFYIPSFGGHFLGSWDSFFEGNQTGSEFHALHFCNLPHLTQSEWELLDSCSKTVHLVEAPSGQRFLIKWYAQNHQPGKDMTFLCRGTKRFMVFREEEERRMCYTEDIGDLCIFLGDNEPFCVKASSFPGLNPNSIYFAGDGFGVYDIASRKPRSFRPKCLSAFSTSKALSNCWIPPMSPP